MNRRKNKRRYTGYGSGVRRYTVSWIVFLLSFILLCSCADAGSMENQDEKQLNASEVVLPDLHKKDDMAVEVGTDSTADNETGREQQGSDTDQREDDRETVQNCYEIYRRDIDNGWYYEAILTDLGDRHFLQVILVDDMAYRMELICAVYTPDYSEEQMMADWRDLTLDLSGTICLTKDELEVKSFNSGEGQEYAGKYVKCAMNTTSLFQIPDTIYDTNISDGKVDYELAMAARKVLGVPDDQILTTADLATVKELEIPYEVRLVSLDGIEFFFGLEKLYIHSGYISDIAPLTGLTNLTCLTVEGCMIETLPDMSGFDSLVDLNLQKNLIRDLTPIAAIPNLQYLDISFNMVTSVAPIKDMTTLLLFSQINNQITDWESISGNIDLQNALIWEYSLEAEVRQTARQILSEIIRDDMTDLEKEIAICQYIHDNTSVGDPSMNFLTPEGYSVLIEKVGVCSDFTAACGLLMQMAGLDVISVNSDDACHAWNMIRLDGRWYHVDCMWDDDVELSQWSYFNISLEQRQQTVNCDDVAYKLPYAACNMPSAVYRMCSD